MSPQLAELTTHAQALTSAGDLAGASDLLAGALASVDTDPLRADPDVAAAAALHARILVTLGDAHTARPWADFAHLAQQRLHGPDDERTLAAAATRAVVLHRMGAHARAVQLYRDVVSRLSEADGPDSLRVLAAQADLATAEHADGRCATARARLGETWQRHRRQHGDAAPAGIKMLARLGAMERDCGRYAPASEHLIRAQELCARYLPGDHPLAIQVASLAQSPASPTHVCRPEQHEDAAEQRHDDRPGVGHEDPAEQRHDDRPGVGHDAASDRPDDTGRPDGRDTGHPGVIPVAAAPGVLAVAGRQPPAVVPAVPAAEPAGARPRRFPAPVGRRIAVAAAIVATAATIAVILPRQRGTAPTVSQSAAAPAPAGGSAPAGAAPTAVSLRDMRDSVALQWSYPAGSAGPVLISGGRRGQEQRAFQQLPAGSTTYVVYGLDAGVDYCFTVAVVYSIDNVPASPAVCTQRAQTG